MNDCLFCKIIQGDIPSVKVFENESVFAFKDIAPMAKEHFLFVSKKHTTDLNDLITNSPSDVSQIFNAINTFTLENESLVNGYRVVTNSGKHGCQSVFHTHFHVLGGEQLKGFGA